MKYLTIVSCMSLAACTSIDQGLSGLNTNGAAQNMEIAFENVCYPFVVNRMPLQDLPLKSSFYQADKRMSAAVGGLAFEVGNIGDVFVALRNSGASRACDVFALLGTPDELRSRALAFVDTLPDMFVPTKSKYAAGKGWVSEDMLCADPRGSHPNVEVFISTAPPSERLKIIITIGESPVRELSCDQAGVPLRSRTLIPNVSSGGP